MRVSGFGFRVSRWTWTRRSSLSSRNSKLETRNPVAAGYTLVAVVIGIAILTILTAAVAPAVSVIMQRDREEELIFRGRQYARGIALFQKRYGRYPNSLKEMYENRPRTIRKLWKEPICGCDDWYLITQGVPATGNDQSRTYPLPAAPQPTPGFGSPGAAKNVGPIIGVRSRIKKNALREWRGQKSYDRWSFVVGDADRNVISTAPPR